MKVDTHAFWAVANTLGDGPKGHFIPFLCWIWDFKPRKTNIIW